MLKNVLKILNIYKFTNKDLFSDEYVINNILPDDLILIENKLF